MSAVHHDTCCTNHSARTSVLRRETECRISTKNHNNHQCESGIDYEILSIALRVTLL
jgi:hypothetical protein